MSDDQKKQLEEFESRIDQFHPGHSIDCVILGYHDRHLKILLLKWKHEELWSLPGGFVYTHESLEDAAYRVLKERTGLGSIFLSQCHTFGDVERQTAPSAPQAVMMENLYQKLPLKDPVRFRSWIQQRFITTGYFALVDFAKTEPRPDFLGERCEWIDLQQLPELLMDHDAIIKKALAQLRIQLNYLPVGLSLLPEKFTIQDLQKVYEAILQKKLDRSNFQRKILKLGFLNRHEKQMTGAANKAPFLYSFDERNYKELLTSGIGFSM